MAWLAVNEDGTEVISIGEPWRYHGRFIYTRINEDNFSIHKYHFVSKLPAGTIKKILGRELTWYDEPVELKAD